MTLRVLPAAVALVLGSAATAAETTHIPDSAVKLAADVRERALKDTTAYDFVADLTTQIGPRLAGSANDRRAVDWTVARFKALGFDKVWTEPVTYPRWVRRSEHGAIVAPYAQPLSLLALGNSPATPKGGVRAEVVAFKDFTALQAADAARVRGKIVYVGYHMKPFKDGHDYGPATAGRTAGPAFAAKLGAVAFVLRSAGSDSDRLPHTGVTSFAPGAKQIPAAAVSNADADLLERELAGGKPVTLALDLDCGIDGQYTGANVIAQLDGSGKPDEIVEIGGHLDSWDPGTGAIDDGAGVATAVGAARVIAGLPQRPKRSIRVVAFANEEAGMFGGKAYSTAHKAEVAKHVLASEADFGSGPIWRLSTQVKPEALGAIDQMMQALAPLGVERGASHAHGGDFGSFGEEGEALVDLTEDGTHYFDWHHTANDTLDKIDPKDLAHNVAVYAVFAYLAAQADGDFGSAPGAFPAQKE